MRTGTCAQPGSQAGRKSNHSCPDPFAIHPARKWCPALTLQLNLRAAPSAWRGLPGTRDGAQAVARGAESGAGEDGAGEAAGVGDEIGGAVGAGRGPGYRPADCAGPLIRLPF